MMRQEQYFLLQKFFATGKSLVARGNMLLILGAIPPSFPRKRESIAIHS